MALLLNELLEMYYRFDREDEMYYRFGSEDPDAQLWEKWKDNSHALEELAAAIFRISDPKTVGDVMTLPNANLRNEGLVHLIRRDASDFYDQVDGFICEAQCDRYRPLITPAQHGFNGLDLCQWIVQVLPVDDPVNSE
jgi:hypothetical protein